MILFIFVIITKLNTNKNDLTNFNKNLPAFVFYFNDSHIYLIKDTAKRKSVYSLEKIIVEK